MRQPNRSVISVAREYAVSRQTLYAWDKEIPNPCINVPEPVMTPPKRDKPAPEAPSRCQGMQRWIKGLGKLVIGSNFSKNKLQPLF